MSVLTTLTVDLVTRGLLGKTPSDVGRLFHNALEIYGLRASFIRSYHVNELSKESVYSRISPPGWEEYYSDRVSNVNFLPREIKRRNSVFAWSEVRLSDAREIAMRNELVSQGFADGLAVPCHGADGYVAAVSLGFRDLKQVSPEEREAIALASLVLHERMRATTPSTGGIDPALTGRERDCLSFAADGRKDWEIANALGISESTVITHLKSARRKLGAINRAQAVAKAFNLGLLQNG